MALGFSFSVFPGREKEKGGPAPKSSLAPEAEGGALAVGCGRVGFGFQGGGERKRGPPLAPSALVGGGGEGPRLSVEVLGNDEVGRVQ